MGENSDDNDPFEEDIVFDQSGLLARRSSYSRQQMNPTFIPTFMLFIRTVFLCVAFTGLGLCASVSQGPIIHLEVAVGVPTEAAFHSFTAHAVGMLIGGVLGSMLFEIYNRQFLIFVSLMWMSVSISVLPFTIPVSYWWTLANLAALGAGMSFLFTGSNVLCLDLWGKAGGASLQSLHFSFAVGAFVAPILLHPLISGSEIPPGSVLVGGANFSTPPTLPFLSLSEVGRTKRDAPGNDSLITREDESFVFTEETDSPLEEGVTPSPISTSPETTFESTPDLTLAEVRSQSPTSGNGSVDLSPVSPEGSPTPSSAKEEASPPKEPKPKPSFTNANLIPEPSKWERPPQKVEPKVPMAPPQSSVATPAATSTTTSSTSTASIPPIVANSTAIESDPTLIPDSHTDSFPKKVVEEIAVESNATVESTEVDSTEDTGNSSVSVTELEETTLLLSSTPGGVFGVNNQEGETTTVSFPSSATEDGDDLGSTNAGDSVEGKFVIDFNNESLSDIEEEELRRQEMAEYVAESMETSVGRESVPPKVLDLKEAPGKEGEASTISVTASFPGGGGGHQSKPGTFSNVTDSNGRFLASLLRRFRNFGVTSIHFVYFCVGLFLLANGCVALALMCHNPREPRSKQEDAGELRRPRIHFFVAVFALYMFSAEALQGAIHHLLASSHTGNGFELPRGSVDGAAAFWGLVAVMRFLCVLVSGCLKIPPGRILFSATSLTVVGAGLLCAGTYERPHFLWGGIVVVGLGLAPVLPTSFLWMAQQMRVTHRMCAIMIITSAFGNSLTHTSLAHVPPNSHFYTFILMGIAVFSLISLCASFALVSRLHMTKTLGVPLGYHLARQEEDESLELTRQKKDLDAALSRRLSEMGEAGQALLID